VKKTLLSYSFDWEIMMEKGKVLSSLLLAGSQLFAVCCLIAFSGQAAALSWHDAPIVGTNVVDNGNGSLTVTVNGSPAIIPDSNTLLSQSVITINPTVWDGISHFYDPASLTGAGSSVNVDTASTYSYSFSWDFLGGPIPPNAPYTAFSYTNTWSDPTFTIAEVWSMIGGFWLQDVGNWQYTESWTGTGGPDAGAFITSTRDFAVAIPEPETYAMLLAGLGLLCFVARRRGAKTAA
jgi:hypothetical protein